MAETETTPAGGDAPPPAPAAPEPTGQACRNCGTPLLGPHCYRCGQPVKGLVRHFTSIIGDFFDSVFDFDSRTFRTLWPLFARPGWLTCEYFEGRRVRYVSPVRLFFFLSIVTFFVAQLTIEASSDGIRVGDESIATATTEADVVRMRDAALASLREARPEAEEEPGARIALDAAERNINREAEKRLAELRGDPPPAADDEPLEIRFNGDLWDAETNPLEFAWLPAFANDWLNRNIGRARDNVAELRDDPERFKNALLGTIPSTLFVLLPVFAVLLKLAYAFRHRLYMEHLIVALHSHAFLCLALLGVFVVVALRDWLAPQGGVLRVLLGFVEFLLFAWMPVYLLLMQKRVYRQGWPMTLLKYALLGTAYMVLLGFGALATLLVSLVWM
ncbi:DUF3667 domain-containing protein [Luteimonas pelagia]